MSLHKQVYVITSKQNVCHIVKKYVKNIMSKVRHNVKKCVITSKIWKNVMTS